MKKTKVFLYKKGCLPRIFVNPSIAVLKDLKKQGVVLINPNEGSIVGLPLHFTYPDTTNNFIRPIPLAHRPEIGDLSNPLEVIKYKKEHVNIHKIAIMYTLFSIWISIVLHMYGKELSWLIN
jgi:hypothetical protein